MKARRYTFENLRAALWAYRCASSAKRQLESKGLETSVLLPRLPPVSRQSEQGVRGALRRVGATCLVRAIVLQRFKAAFDENLDLVIGVTAPKAGFRAHAWLDGDGPCHEEDFSEMLRVSADPRT